jgi:short-subunit dehydrogenase
MNLSGRTVLLTGATGGLGHAIARALSARGAKLLLTGRRTEVLEPLAEQTGGRAIACDLSDRDALESLVAEARQVDVLIANAGLPASGTLLGFSEAEIDRALDVNLRAPMVLARHLAEAMAARRSGHLVFVSSMAGKVAPVGSSVYSATKYGLRGFALSLRQDLHGTGVGVSTVFPGFISDAGLFADAGVELPRYVATNSSDDVARAVIKAIERNRAEVDVAPLTVRAGGLVASVVPDVVAAFQRRLGAEDIADRMAEGQRDKR